MIGKVFGRLTVVGEAERGKSGHIQWKCRCICGKETITTSSKLKTGHTKSCGCYQALGWHRTHGMSETVEYTAWRHMKERCNIPTATHFIHYGGRGIKVCDSWNNSFENFIADMGTKPFLKAQLDRLNNNGDYSPDNCRWADVKTNCRNRRSNNNIIHNGITRSLAEWSELTGIGHSTILHRLTKGGWSVEQALTIPARKRA